MPSDCAWCFRHGCYCKIPFPPKGSLVFHAAGSTCVDWSLRSRKALRWLGMHMIPFVVWAKSRARCREQLILHEWVSLHPVEFLLNEYLGDVYVVISFLICPSVLGFPTTRRRRFSVCIHQGGIGASLTTSPMQKFAFRVIADGDIYFSAQWIERDSFLAAHQAASFREMFAGGGHDKVLAWFNDFQCACEVYFREI